METFIITQDLAERILGYLGKCPIEQVNDIFNELRRLEPSKPCCTKCAKKEKKDEKKIPKDQ